MVKCQKIDYNVETGRNYCHEARLNSIQQLHHKAIAKGVTV